MRTMPPMTEPRMMPVVREIPPSLLLLLAVADMAMMAADMWEKEGSKWRSGER